ncbi:hypothetical protein Tco_1318945 [Tanacetum coccineum]
MLVEMIAERKRFFVAQRAAEQMSKPPTKAQIRNRCVNTFVPMDSDVVEGSNKAKADTEQESSTKRAVPEDGDDVTIDATPLSTRSPNIVDYKIYKERKKSFFQTIKAYVKDRFKKTEPENYMDNYLLLTLKIMFEHHFEDSIWKKQQRLTKVNNWELFDSCEVYCMFNDVKLQVGYECEMAYELLRLVKRQLKEGYVPESCWSHPSLLHPKKSRHPFQKYILLVGNRLHPHQNHWKQIFKKRTKTKLKTDKGRSTRNEKSREQKKQSKPKSTRRQSQRVQRTKYTTSRTK